MMTAADMSSLVAEVGPSPIQENATESYGTPMH